MNKAERVNVIIIRANTGEEETFRRGCGYWGTRVRRD
jgi:hypothetical protein